VPEAPAVVDAELPARRASPRRRVLQAVLSVAVVVAIFVGVLPRITSYSDVWEAITAMTGVEAAILVAVGIFNLLTYGPVLMASLPGLTFGQSMVVTQSSTAIANTIPGGAAFGIGVTVAMYASWGFRRAAITLSVIVTGIWNNFVKLGMPIIALGLVALLGKARAGLVIAALVGLVVLAAAVGMFAAVLASDDLARRIGAWSGRAVSRLRRAFRRPPVTDWDEAAVRFRHETIGLVRHRWLALSVTTLVSHLSLFAVLLISLRNVGVSDDQVGWAEVLAAFAFVRLLSALPITPGGLGVVELGMTAALVAAGGERTEVVAGVLVYRALTYLPPIPIGAVTYVVWRRKSGWRRPAPAEAAA
jgi:putative heme transporter